MAGKGGLASLQSGLVLKVTDGFIRDVSGMPLLLPIDKQNNAVVRTASCLDGGTGRHPRLKISWALRPCGFDSRSRHH